MAPPSHLSRVLLLAAATASLTPATYAQTWSGATTGSNLAWGTGANWSSGSAPSSTTAAINFELDWSSTSIALGAARTVNSITFDDIGTGTDSTLTINNGGTTTHTLTFGGTNPTANIRGSILSISANAGGVLTKSGAGILELRGTNTFTSFTLSEGTVRINNEAGFGGASGVLAFNGGTVSTVGATARVVTAAGASTIGGNVTFGDATNNGALTFANAFTVSNSPTLNFASNVTFTGQITGSFNITTASGASVTFNKTNRNINGTVVLSGSTTLAIWNNTNGLDVSNNSTALTIHSGATARITVGSNLASTLRLGSAGFTGGRLELGATNALVAQFQNSFITVSGTSQSVILNTTGNTGFGLSGNSSSSRIISVNSTGDSSGIDLDLQANWRNGTLNKEGAGVLRLGSGFVANFSNNLTTVSTTGSAINVKVGTFINEGTIKSIATVSGGTLKTGSASGTFDQVNVTSGAFEVSRSSGLFTEGLTYAAGNNALNLRGGTLRYVGVNTDYSAVMGDLSGNSAVNTNGQDVTFATGLTGTGGLTKGGLGTLTLAGANTFTGAVAVNNGTLAFTNAGNQTISGLLSGTGDLAKSGAGRLTFAAGSTFTGNLSVDEGSLGLALSSDPATGLAAYDIAGATPSSLSVGNLTFAAGTSAKLLVNGTAGTVANGTYAFLTLTNATLPDIGAFVAPVWNDSGSALGRRQSASLAYAGNVVQMTVIGSLPVWSGSAGMGWSTADTWRLDTDSSATSFIDGDSVLFDDTGTAGTITLDSAVAPSAIAVAAGTKDYTFAAAAGSIAAGTLTKSGAALLRLTGTHTPIAVSLSAGRLAADTGALGSGTLTLSGGALSAAGTDPASFSNAITLSGNTALGDATDNGALTLSGNIALGSSVRTLEVRSAATLSGILSGTSGGLTKTGSADLTLTGVNTFTGATRVSEGTLRVGTDNLATGYLGSTSGITVDSGATLLLLSDNAISGFSGTARTFTLSGTLDAATYNTNVGALTLSGGELAGVATAGGYGNYNLRGNVTVSENSTISAARFNTAAASRNFTVAADKTLTVSGVLTNEGLAAAGTASSLSKLGAGTMLLTGANTFTGTLTVAQGNVVLSGGDDRLLTGGTVVLGATSTSGRLVLEGVSQTLASLTSTGLGGSVVGGSETLSTLLLAPASGTLTFAGVLGGAGTNENNLGLTKSGAGILELGGANTLTGPILVSSGTLRPTASGALGSGSSVTLAANSTAQLLVAAADLSFNRALTIGGGTGGVAAQGALHYSGTTGSLTWSGPITVSADITTGGHFGAATGGELNLSGAISAAAGVPVEFRIGRSTLSGAGSAYSILYLHSDSTVRMGAADILPSGVEIKMGTSANAASLDLNGFSQSAGSLSNATAAFANASSGVTNSSATGATLTLTGSSIGGVDNTVISNTATATGVLNISPGTGALSLNLDTGGATPVINAGLGVTIGATLTSADGFTKTGSGNLTLTANNSAGLAGTLAIEAGALVSRSSGAMGTGIVRLSNAAAGVNGNLLQMDTAAQTHEVDFEVLASGQIRANNVLATLNGDFTLGDGVTLTFRGQGGASNRFLVTGDTSLAEGATGANLAFSIDSAQNHSYTGALNLGTGSLIKTGSGGAPVSINGTLVAGGITASAANLTVNASVTAAGPSGSLLLSGNTTGATTLAGAITAATVTKTGTSSQVLSGLSDIDALAVEAGSIVLAGGANSRLGASSVLTLGGETTSGKLILGSSAGATSQTLAGLTLSGLGGSIVGGNGAADSLLTLDLSSDLTLGAFLGGAGANENRVGLAKSGAGILTLSAANTFAGGTTVSAGTLLLGDVAALGTGTVTVSGGTLDLANLAITNAIVFAGGSVVNNGAWTGSASVNGTIDNAYLASLPGSSFTIAAGSTVDLTSLTALGGKTLVYTGGTLTGSSDVLVEIANGTTLGAGFGAGRALVKTGNTVTLTSAFTRAVRFEGGTLAGLADYAGALTVGGNSVLDLDGSGDVAVTTAASLTVESGSTLKGTGIFGGGVISGVHAPGNSPGIQTSQGNLTYNSGASFEWELADNTDIQGAPAAIFDQVIVNGDLAFSGTVSLSLVFNADGSAVDWSNVFWDEARSWVLYDVSGSLAGFSNLSLQTGDWEDTFATPLATLRPGFTFRLSQSGSDVLLNYEAIPEPSTYGLILGGLALAGAALRRRKRNG